MGCCFLRKTVEGDHAKISVECVRELLKESRTDPTVANDFGETALDLAKSRGYEESAKLVEAAVKEWSKRTDAYKQRSSSYAPEEDAAVGKKSKAEIEMDETEQSNS
mmetsp:Transcript_49868/g.149939  ORF Transcript_49868/g.149939 Transcript_49868/m.149939 type:complete len:107 (-) Transcript_49868:121-441(-)